MNINKTLVTLCASTFWLASTLTHAGNLDSPAAPSSAASAMYQLEDIYQRLNNGTAGSKRSGAFTEPDNAPNSSGHTLDEVMGKAPLADNTNGVAPGEVLQSKTYWGLRTDGSWGQQTGTVPAGSNVSGANGSKTFTIPNGMYTGSKTATANDPNLISGNIRSGSTILGVSGHSGVVDTDSGTAVAADILSGKKAWVDGAEVTGTASGSTASGNAADGDVLTGKTYSNDSGSSTGTMANIGAQGITPGTTSQTITQGYHNGSGSVSGDGDLVTGNIKSGSNIFGVAGDSNVVDTSTGDAAAGDIQSGKKAWVDGSEITGTATGGGSSVPAPVEKTGQSLCYDPSGSTGGTVACAGTGQDGETQIGTAWPTPRFTDNGDGTVTDKLTDLIWLKSANCFGARNWSNALNDANTLADGSCSLTDSSSAGDWRLPNVKELQSLIDFNFYNPVLSNAAGTAKWTSGDAFTGVQSLYYWSSSSHVYSPQDAWVVNLYNGPVVPHHKANGSYVWPVRAGQ